MDSFISFILTYSINLDLINYYYMICFNIYFEKSVCTCTLFSVVNIYMCASLIYLDLIFVLKKKFLIK